MENDIAKFLYEMGQLKRVKRSGWWIAGIRDPETVAEHSFRTAVIAHILAQLEGADREKAVSMSLFHDIAEARTNDAHRIVRRYADWEGVDRRAVEDQSQRLPDKIAEGITSMISEFEQALSLEGRVARDADLLECLLQAREYQALGYHDVGDWILNAQTALTTESAKRIAAECLRTEPKEWWQGLKASKEKRGFHGD